MADKFEDKKKPIKDISSDSGLGNLPPLSDFDSQGGLGSDGGLPPLGSFDSGTPGTPSDSDLPAISDIDVETPTPPSGGRAFKSNVKDTFSSGTPLDTPHAGSRAGSGFQDLAADSDFSPETPEIGPGPDSNVDTPMFDSAFGAGDHGFSGATLATPAPTQAMETPMFGMGAPSAGGSSGFDAGGFRFDAGTPPPDFSPDTDMQGLMPPTTGAGTAGGKKAKGGGGGSPVVLALVAVVCIVIGLGVGPFVESMMPIPTPMKAQVEKLTQDVAVKDNRIRELMQGSGGKQAPPNIDELQQRYDQLQKQVTETESALNTVTAQLTEQQNALTQVKRELSLKEEEYTNASALYEDLQNETAIIQARQRGLIAEVDRLTSQVGNLEEANVRRIASKEALGSAIDRLYVQVAEGIPLTPQKYDHAARTAAVQALRDKVSESSWVTPELVNAYTNLYLTELQIAAAQEYFFARLAVRDNFGNQVFKWAECLMQGNQSVYYRTLDGKNIGIFRNLGETQAPRWGFDETISELVRKEVENRVIAARVEGFEQKVAVLAQKEVAAQQGSAFQRAFDSL